MTGSLTFPPWKGGSQTEWAAQCGLSVGGGRGELLWWVGCQPGVIALMDLYGKLMPSGTSQETLMDGGQVCCMGSLLSLTSALAGVHGELTLSNMGYA